MNKYLEKIELAVIFLIVSALAFGCYEEEIFIEPSGKIKKVTIQYEDQNTFVEYAHFYNGREQLVKKVLRQGGNELGEIEYDYNADGQLIKEENNIPHNYEENIYSYDEQGKLINQTGTNQSFDVFYDSLGRMASKKYYSHIDKKYPFEINFEYDPEFPERVKIETQSGGGKVEVYEYVYDQDGRLDFKQLIDGPEWLIRGPKESFVYDNTGRLYKKVTYELNKYWYTGVDNTETYYYFE